MFIYLFGLPSWLSGKESSCQFRRHWRHEFILWVRKIPWRRKCLPTPVFLPGKSHGQKSLVGSSPSGHNKSDTIKRLSMHTFIYLLGCTRSQLQPADSLIFTCSGLWDLVLQPGIQLRPPALGPRSPSHWTSREVLTIWFSFFFFLLIILMYFCWLIGSIYLNLCVNQVSILKYPNQCISRPFLIHLFKSPIWF